jgi:GT2 family glycosyltransferase
VIIPEGSVPQVPDVTVSLVAVNQRTDLERLLPMLLKAAAAVNAEVLLVANRCDDRSAEFVLETYPAVSVLRTENRAGYGENHNLNLARASGRYFVIMNVDMEVREDTLSELFSFMEANPDVGLSCPKVLNPDGSIQGLNRRLPTIWDLFLRRFMPRRLRGAFRKRLECYEMRDVGYDSSYDVPFVSGAFMFARTSLLKALGGFDERYFLYYEDADLSRRVQRTHRTSYWPKAVVTHYWARRAHMGWLHTGYHLQSALQYFRTWGVRVW